jgi:methionyl-tRNA formyltransferase
LNVHPSLLPRFGGPQPEVQAILHEQQEAGVSVHTITPEFDAGPLRAQRSFRVHAQLTVGDLEAHAAALGAACIETLLGLDELPVLEPTQDRSYFKALPSEAADLSRCRSLAEARKLLRLRPEIYAYYRHGESTVYPLLADERPCGSPSLALPDGTLHCHEWVLRASDGALTHHRCDCGTIAT